MAYEKHGLKSIVYRPFSGYGEDQDDSYPFPAICKRALNLGKNKQMKVWGSGLQMRDFIHIEDCIDGILKTMDKIDDASALNLSTGIYTSFLDFGSMALKECGWEGGVIGMSGTPEGVFARGGDTAKQKQFGFKHKISIEIGVKRAIEYYEKSCHLGT
jgi:GDP-L-fucose synthase